MQPKTTGRWMWKGVGMGISGSRQLAQRTSWPRKLLAVKEFSCLPNSPNLPARPTQTAFPGGFADE